MPTNETAPNILFILTDQWRGDCLGYTGHPAVETPHLDYLAGDGITFTQAYASCPVCVAARATILTGLAPKRHGYLTNGGVQWDYSVTLPGTLSDAGYHTQCVGKMHVYPWRNLVGFHNVVLHDGYMHRARRENREFGLNDDYTPWLREKLGAVYADHNDSGVGCNGYAAQAWPYHEMLHPTSWVTSQGIDFLRRRDTSKPFFLTLSYHRPHPPLDPPASFLNRYLQKDIPPPAMGNWVDHELRKGGHDSPIPRDPALVDYARRAYYAQISHIDFQINRMIMALNEYGVQDNTAILFTADHGEMLYDHNHVGKGVPYDGSARVPFILRMPKTSNAVARGTLVDSPVELRDIFPTFCDIAGIDTPDDLDGESVLNCGGNNWRPFIHGEHATSANQWLTDGKEKYAWFTQTGRELLFDLTEDPREINDLSRERPDRLAWWRDQLIEELTGRPEGFVQNGKLVPGRPIQGLLPHVGKGVPKGAI